MNHKVAQLCSSVLVFSIPAYNLAQAAEEADQSKLVGYLAAWIPLLIIFGVLLWFTRYARQTQMRARQHMDEVEKKLSRIVDILESNQKGR